jgi:hypothetical protein
LQCANNLKQIALALNDYAATMPSRPDTLDRTPTLPAGTVPHAELPPERRLSWVVEVLPFVEQDSLFPQIDRRVGWDDAANATAVRTPLKLFLCAGGPDEPPNLTTYVGVAGLGADAPQLPAGDRRVGVFGYDRRTALADVRDGTSNTLLLLESARLNGPWAQGGPSTVRGLDPTDRPYLGTGRPFGGTHFAESTVFSRGTSIGCNAAMVDGSVHFLREKVAPQVLEALATVAGGENVGSDW